MSSGPARKSVKPTTAMCAVGPGGTIDIDLVRRSESSARGAASQVMAMAWPGLQRQGWRIITVRITELPADLEPESVPPPAPPPSRQPGSAVAMGRKPAGGVRMLRCGVKESA